MTPETASEVIFFLGAGASVGAGVPDTFGLVDVFKTKIASQTENLRAVDKILEILKEWKRRQGDKEQKVDIELLLETIERLENRNQDILLKFYSPTEFVLEGYANKKPLKDELRDFIKEVGIVGSKNIRYMKPVLGFIAEHRPIDIFSVNYDICIEQFCNTYKKECIDGFDIKWNPKLFERTDADVRLYKLHGSVMWYRTDRGDYVKLPIMSHSAETELITGEKAETLILYPMRKWEYAEPLLELLVELKKKLEKAKFLFVVGYSFRDEHIRRIFWDAARKNKDLVVFLISPNAHRIYHERLKDYETPGLPHGFSSDFSYEDFDAYAPSELSGRVVCLPYKFENVLPLLKNRYLRRLNEGLVRENDLRDRENKGESVAWWLCLQPFVECEHMEKVNEIVLHVDWNEYRNNNWQNSVEVSFGSFLNSLSSPTGFESDKWLKNLNDSLSVFSTDNLRFGVMVSPEEIRLAFGLTEISEISAKQAIETIERLFEACKLKTSLLDKDKIKKINLVKNKIEHLHNYLLPWKTRHIIVRDYIQLRKTKYPELVEEFTKGYVECQMKFSADQHIRITAIVKEIESNEFGEICGGPRFQINL